MSYAGETPTYTTIKSGNINIIGDIVYFGEPTTDGSWRITKDSGNLKIEKRIAGVWVTRDTIE
jgi:hypothetical protein